MRQRTIQRIFCLILFYIWCCAAHRFDLPRHLFMRNFGDHIIFHDKFNSTIPLTFDIRLRYKWSQDRLVIIDPSVPEKVLYKIICQTKDYCRTLGWTRNRTNVTVLASLNPMVWYPYPTDDDDFALHEEQERNETADIIKSKALLQQPLLISTELYNETFNVTFFPLQKKYIIGYDTHQMVAEVENFDRSTPQYHSTENYSLQIFENINSNIDPAFLISICILIDYAEWPHYLHRT